MDLDSSFTVNAPIEQVWATVMDIEKIATAVPGAELTEKLSDTSYQGVVRVKVGPLKMQYKGQIDLVSRDDVNHVATFRGKGQEKAGQGTAEGTAILSLTQEGDVTTGVASGSVALSGKAAAMGRGIIDKVAQQMMKIFAGNLQTMLTDGDVDGGDSSNEAVHGLSVMAGAVGSMFRRDKDKKQKDEDKKQKDDGREADAGDEQDSVEAAPGE
jgi:carbon monoxide dehydrogenase subunit G